MACTLWRHIRRVAAEKPPKVTIAAIMRMLAILANTLLCEYQTWMPKSA